MRLKDADALVEQLSDKAKEMLGIAEQCQGAAINYYTGAKYGFAKSAIIANGLPTIDPVKHGKWILQDTSYWRATHAGDVQVNRFNLKCPFCGWRNHESNEFNYCPNCGAKMEGVKNEHTD